MRNRIVTITLKLIIYGKDYYNTNLKLEAIFVSFLLFPHNRRYPLILCILKLQLFIIKLIDAPIINNLGK